MNKSINIKPTITVRSQNNYNIFEDIVSIVDEDEIDKNDGINIHDDADKEQPSDSTNDDKQNNELNVDKEQPSEQPSKLI